MNLNLTRRLVKGSPLTAIEHDDNLDKIESGVTVVEGTAATALQPGGPLATPASGTLTSCTGLPLDTGVTGLLAIHHGGTGTITPSLVAGTNVSIAGTWPNQTISASAGGGGVLAVTGTAPIVSSGGPTPAISITPASGSAAGSMSQADFTKLAGVATGATANATDAQLRDRSTHTGTQLASTVSDFNASSRAQTEATLLAGTNVTLTPAGSGATRTITIAATAGGGGVSSVTGTAPIASSGGSTPAISIAAASGVTAGSMSSADFTKLAGVAAGATANLGTVTNTTGTAPIQVATGTTTPVISITAATTAAAGSMSGPDKTKLDGVATGATANSTDAQLRDRSTHTGTQLAATISDFPASSRAQTEAMLTAGTNVTLTPSGTGATRSIQISATAGGGGVSTVTATAPITSTGGGSPDIGIVPASGTVPGSMSSANFTKLAGIATGATANATDAQLRDRATHTGTQAWSTLTTTPTTRAGYGITDAAANGDIGGTGITLSGPGIAGRSAAGSGSATLITLGTNLSFTGNVLNAAGGGGGTPGGVTTEAQFNNAGTFDGASGLIIDTATKRIARATFINVTTPATPAEGFTLYALNGTGAFSWIGANGFTRTIGNTTITANRTWVFPDRNGTLSTDDFLHANITYAATVNLDATALAGSIRTITLTGNLTFTASNYAVGKTFGVRLIAGAANRTLAWPAGWVGLGVGLPTLLLANKTARFTVECFGSAATDVVVGYSSQP